MSNSGVKKTDTSLAIGDRAPLQVFYPDAQAIFDFALKPISAIKNECFVGLDANVLLLPYQMDKFSLSGIASVYKKLRDERRLVVPAQAAREFAKHRPEKIGNIVHYLSKESSSISRPLSKKIGIMDADEEFQDLLNLIPGYVEHQKKIRDSINKIVDKLKDPTNDPVSNEYRDSLNGCVVNYDLTTENLDKFEQERCWRFKVERAPGFKDADKPDGGSGDLIIWKTILAEGKRRQQDCLFCTLDSKPDWWVQQSGAFQPRPELVDEFREFTSGKSIHPRSTFHVVEHFRC